MSQTLTRWETFNSESDKSKNFFHYLTNFKLKNQNRNFSWNLPSESYVSKKLPKSNICRQYGVKWIRTWILQFRVCSKVRFFQILFQFRLWLDVKYLIKSPTHVGVYFIFQKVTRWKAFNSEIDMFKNFYCKNWHVVKFVVQILIAKEKAVTTVHFENGNNKQVLSLLRKKQNQNVIFFKP